MYDFERNERLVRIWHNMKQRCYNKNAKGYQWYGGKGVKICEEWMQSFKAFQDWAVANGYADNLTIDRIDSDKDYCPENCRWITHSENAARSHKGNVYSEHMGPLKFQRLAVGMTLSQLSKASGVNVRQIQRVESGSSTEGNMTAKNLLTIADALGVDPHILLEG